MSSADLWLLMSTRSFGCCQNDPHMTNRTSTSLAQHIRRTTLGALFATLSMLSAAAHAEMANVVLPPAKLQVSDKPVAARPGVTDLKFGELFKMPVGPMGLQASDKLSALVGKQVRMVGYVANAEEATPGMLVLTPLPVTLGDEDERLVDDLPPTAVFVHLSPKYANKAVPNLAGLIRLEGRLELGAQDEADGHTSTTRLVLNDATSALLAAILPAGHAAGTAHRTPTHKRVATLAR